jgi:glycosyltransferase involved in cell wall biosynthesis
LGQLLSVPTLRDRMGEAGRQRVMDHFTSEQMAARYQELYLGAKQAEPDSDTP